MNAPTYPNSPPVGPAQTDSSIGGLLLESGKITPENAERVLRMQKELGIRFGEAAQRLGLITETDLQQVLARQFEYPYLQAGEGKFSPKLVAAYQPFSEQVEQLRAVRSQLMLRWFARGHRSLTIMEVDADDGASTFAANLAVVFSQLGEQTLLVDANLRTPHQRENFDLQGRQGLSDVLAGRADLSAVTKVPSFVDLSVLPAGTLPPNPQELLSRAQFGILNTQLEANHAVVLYDVAPFSVGADALAVAVHTRGVLLVARRHQTSLDDIADAAEKLTQAGVQVVGSVLVDA
ncbi:chain length determinant protein tyrosine kinase EpsG [Pseudoduganella sp. FT93W]|uniref:Chain length determinant protein tyrosine kinase EpsG n=1 Tax=Duganella fentianensis TaxID=2692177 RepID=A0A845I5I1_9BURK|nr:chain length determinant protein tyrosine kinase EpsG [Duganella fentianensis]MYN47371.1 chain length determinant protein tyrosine kinase EpsG [Duganella fentianensis]